MTNSELVPVPDGDPLPHRALKNAAAARASEALQVYATQMDASARNAGF